MRREGEGGELALGVELAGEAAAVDVEGFEDLEDQAGFNLPVEGPEDDVEVFLACFEPVEDAVEEKGVLVKLTLEQAEVAAVELDENRAGAERQVEWLLDLDRALDRLAERDPRLARAFECRFFAGLSEAETAEALGVSLRSAQREWMRARAWIRAEL